MEKSRLADLTETVEAGRDLSPGEAKEAALALASAADEPAVKERFLVALSEKGEAGAEVYAFAEAFRDLSRDPGVDAWAERAIDVCGTGGDRQGTFNISTVVALVLASAGVPVFKHGNSSVTSSCGSADLLQALGVPLEIEPGLARRSLEELSFVFFFAPAYHPAFKEIVPVRKSLAAKGKPTIFNILGPMINPGRPAHQLMGVYSETWVPVLAEALHQLKLEGGYVVHGRLPDGAGMDEMSCATENRVAGFGRFRGTDEAWKAGRYSLPECSLSELAGGGVAENLRLFQAILQGEGPPGLVDSIVLNAAFAFEIQGKAATIEEGLGLAREQLLGGAVGELCRKIKAFYAA